MTDSSERDEYKPTFMDRHGPEGGDLIRAVGYGLMVFGLTFGAIIAKTGFSFLAVLAAAVAGTFTGSLGWMFGTGAGLTMRRFTMGGNTTPYVEQYSYQQALVMKGQIDEALESFEAVIAEQREAPDPRVKAAELYVKERGNHLRAVELFREVQRIEATPKGQYIYATHRLVDIYTGPLNEPGKALVELRKLIDRFPGSAVAENARVVLAELKARHF